MKRIYIFILAAVWFVSGPLNAGAQEFPEASYYLLRMVNQARLNPLETLARLGIDEASAREVLGERQWILDTGLPPFAAHPDLGAAASAHNLDMEANFYYSHTSLDGRTPADRIAQTGYEAQQTGENLGALAFAVFIEPNEAAELIFINMLRGELDPARGGELNLLNPDFTEIGISFAATLLYFSEDLPMNVYLVVVNCARPLEPTRYIVGNLYMDADLNGLMGPEDGIAGANIIFSDVNTGSTIFTKSTYLGHFQFAPPQGEGMFMLQALDSSGQVLDWQMFNLKTDQSIQADLRID